MGMINEICTFAPKSKIKAGEATKDGQYIFFTSSEDESKKYNDYIYDGEGIIMGTGGNATLHYYNGKYATSTDCLVLLPDKKIIDCKYLYYFFLSKMGLLEAGFKGAGLKHTNKKYISNIEINYIPSKEQQLRVVGILDKVIGLIEICQQEIDKLNQLVKSRFVEMFGDPKLNNYHHKIIPFDLVVEYMGDIGSNGANKVVVEHLDMKDEEDYALMVRFLNFTNNDFTNNVKYISKESYDFFKKSKLFGGELIICKIGSAGLNYVMPNLNRPVSLGLNQIMVRLKKEILMPYLYQYLHTEYGEFLISECVNGAVTKSITKTKLKELPLMLPPIHLQSKYADFVTKVEQQKATVQKSIDKLETLKKSLMQEYFG